MVVMSRTSTHQNEGINEAKFVFDRGVAVGTCVPLFRGDKMIHSNHLSVFRNLITLLVMLLAQLLATQPGLPYFAMASFRASTQKSASMLFHKRQDRTLRLYGNLPIFNGVRL